MLFNVEIRGMRPIIQHSDAGLDPKHPANIEKPDGRAAWPARPGWISQQRYCRELLPRRGRLYYCGENCETPRLGLLPLMRDEYRQKARRIQLTLTGR